MILRHLILKQQQKNSVALSPQANYTDWATANLPAKFSVNFCG
jgi:hypothetical protein